MRSVFLVAVILVLSGCGNGPSIPIVLRGEKGDRGDVGAAGKNGSSCTTSVVAVSESAPNGGFLISCQDGTSAVVLNGSNGQNGSDGAQGLPGSTGSAGAPGSNGTSCSVSAVAASGLAPNGGALITCGSSTTLVQNGAPGATGETGAAGANASSVSFVKFCPNVSNNYPSTFPEYGICVNGSIFAIYWSGSTAFGSVLPAGGYSSTSINSNCSFTIVANSCAVQN